MLSGYAGVGKDTVGQMLIDHHGYCRVAFADALKDEVAMLYSGIERFRLDDQTYKASQLTRTTLLCAAYRSLRDQIKSFGLECDKACVGTVRGLLIEHGQNQRRLQGNSYYADLATRNLLSFLAPYKVVITDWRFPDEHTEVLKLGHPVITCRVDRHGVHKAADATDTLLDSFPFRQACSNPGTLADLKLNVDALVHRIASKQQS